MTVYEPDPGSFEQIQRTFLKNNFTKEFAKVNIVPYCIGSGDQEISLYLCFDRNTCSTLPFNNDFADWSHFCDKFDRGANILGISNKAQKFVRIPSYSLDSLLEECKINQPDALSIDAEGASMDIIRGAEITLSGTVAVFLEASVLPMRLGEASFNELLSVMQEKSFLLVSLGNENRLSMKEQPAGVYDSGIITTYEDAIFLRDPRTIVDPNMLFKLAFVALLNGCTSIMHICFDKLEEFGVEISSGPDVLVDFYNTYKEVRILKMPKLDEMNTDYSYNVASYVMDLSEVDTDLLKATVVLRNNLLPKYIPVLKSLLRILKKKEEFTLHFFRSMDLVVWLN